MHAGINTCMHIHTGDEVFEDVDLGVDVAGVSPYDLTQQELVELGEPGVCV